MTTMCKLLIVHDQRVKPLNDFLKHEEKKSSHNCHFIMFFQFLLEMIDDTLIVDGMNIQESIPRVLKMLG